MILLLLACATSEPVKDTADATTPSTTTPTMVDSGTTTTTTTTDPTTPTRPTDGDPYAGRQLDPPLPPPTFAVVNQDGTDRTEEWLAGSPTVLWFYRDASDAG